MRKDEEWAGRQLTLGLSEEEERPLPESTTRKLVEALQEALLLAGMEIARRTVLEVSDED